MTILRTRRRRRPASRSQGRAAAVLTVAAVVLVVGGALEHFAGPVIAVLAAGLTAGFIVGRMTGGPRPRRRRRP